MNLTLKEYLYYVLATRNSHIRSEYETYKKVNPEEHRKHPLRSLWKLFKLNLHYRVFHKKNHLYYEANSGLPYLDGSESEAFKRQNVMHFTKELLPYDVVSFDIFDTLILRPFAKPTDLFMLIGYALGIPDFHEIRISAEKKARSNAFEIKGTNEISIYDIYDIISKKTGLDKEKGINTELEYEKRYCYANPYMKRVFDMLIELGKQIIITSDMYIPNNMMSELLTTVGYKDYKKLYVSCDYNKNKRLGDLYDIVKEDFADKSIIHIGDNWITDIQSAQEKGLDTKYYRNCHEIGNKYRSVGMTELIGSAYAGIINTHLHNGTKTYNPYYEYGFIYGGLYILGYCNWLHDKALANNIDKIFFLARDGCIYKKVFDMLFPDFPNEYVLWSRIANSKYSLKSNKNDFLRKVLLYRANNQIGSLSIKAVLASVSLDCLIEKLPKYNLSSEDILTLDNKDTLEQLFLDNWDIILEKETESLISCKSYIARKICNSKKIAVVDVGWQGSGPLGIKNIIKNEFTFDCEIQCYLAAFCTYNATENLTLLMDNTIQSYVFSRINNTNLYYFHKNTNNKLNNGFFEMFTQNKTPSFSGWDNNSNFCFDYPEIENYPIIEELHKGILDFCSLYINTFKKDSILFSISGYDAYTSFRHSIKDTKLVKNLFGNCAFSRGVGFDSTKFKDYWE